MTRFVVSVLFTMFFVTLVAVGQEPAKTVSAPPTLTAEQRLQVQYLYTQRELLISKFNEAKLQFDKISADLDKQFRDVSEQLQKSANGIYEATKTNPSDWSLDLSKGEFVKPEPVKPVTK